jgi:uridine phosphorylase
MNTQEMQKHIRCRPGDIAPVVLVPGDPGRAHRIAEYFDDCREVAHNREYILYTGTYQGVPVGVCSTGIGGPAASIAFEELARVGVTTLIRVGSAGGRQPDIPLGTPIVIHATYRGEGTSTDYLPLAFPAVADLDLTNILLESLKQKGVDYRSGIGYTRDAYYLKNEELNTQLREAGIVAAEQEAAVLFIVGHLRGMRTACIVSTDSNIWLSPQPTLEEKDTAFRVGEVVAIEAALDTAVAATKAGLV